MPDTNLDIERRLELAVVELLKAYTLLTALTTDARVFLRRDTSHAADYPCATVFVINAAELGPRAGWYKCALQLAGLTYRENDKSRDTLKQIIGALRAWGQQSGLEAALNASTSGSATATKLDVEDIRLEGGSFDASQDKVQEEVVTLAVLCRPSQDTTTAII
jgi:hypothetical protein